MTKSESISLRVTPGIKKALERAARADQRTIAVFVEVVLAEWLREKGYLRTLDLGAYPDRSKIRPPDWLGNDG